MITLNNIVEVISNNMSYSIDFGENKDTTPVSNLIKLNLKNKDNTKLFWVSPKYISAVKELETGILIAPNEELELVNFTGTLIKCEFPRRAFSLILQKYFLPDHAPERTLETRKDLIIGEGTRIEDDVKIGKNCTIGYNNVILKGTVIGDNVKIGNNNTIGGIGFGYEKDEEGIWVIIPHIGTVRIDDDVEIGNNNCIDRAVLGITHLKSRCKVDNLTHISHGCTIGHNSLIIANAVLCGSVTIGDNTWVAPSTSIINGTDIGSNSMIGLGAVVLKDVEDGSIIIGNPGKKLERK